MQLPNESPAHSAVDHVHSGVGKVEGAAVGIGGVAVDIDATVGNVDNSVDASVDTTADAVYGAVGRSEVIGTCGSHGRHIMHATGHEARKALMTDSGVESSIAVQSC